MENKRKHRATPFLIGILATALMVSAYLAAYVVRSTAGSGPIDFSRLRIFSSRWEALLFWPAMYGEGMMLGWPVYVVFDEELHLVYQPNLAKDGV